MGIFDSLEKKVESRQQGIKVSDLLGLPRAHRTLMNRIIREQQITLAEAAGLLEITPGEAREILDSLVENGYLKCEEGEEGEEIATYHVHYGRTNPKDIPGSLWAAIGEKVED
jgi:hypothetical protein